MDPEQTFLRVHDRLSGMLSQLLTPRIRLALEYMYLAVAVTLFCLLVVMHTNFVQQPGCSKEISKIEFTEAQLIQIKIIGTGLWAQHVDDDSVVRFRKQECPANGPKLPDVNGDAFTILTSKFWLHWFGSGARRSKLIFKSCKSDKEVIEPNAEAAFENSISKTAGDQADIKTGVEGIHTHLPISSKQSLGAAIIPICSRWQMHLSSFWKNANQFVRNASQLRNNSGWSMFHYFLKDMRKIRMEHLGSRMVQWLGKRSKAFQPTYLYTHEKGFFLLPEAEKSRHGIHTANITLSAQDSCFGNRWQQLLINSFVGYDTILINSLLSSPGRGYLYNFQTKEFYGLSYGHEASGGPASFGDYFVTKCGVLIMSLFVFFTTTMSVSFTLRETQSRMLRFTVQLQHHARHRLPTFQLIFVHVIESLVFVPIMIGILFFLFEFYDDQLLAFLVLTLVWLCELFTMISVRTSISMQFFPRFFLLYFLVFHIYFFSYPYGFSYLAFSTTAAFMQHLILYFWNRFEVPALQRLMRNRGQLQHQPGVQITSSTIYTSTLHIARVNARESNSVNAETGSALQFLTRHELDGGTQEESSGNNRDSARNPSPFRDLNNHQAGTTPGPSLINPFASIMLWVLGGASSVAIVSFFSMFRDVPGHGHAYEERQRHEQE